mgnify:CR=1 FL=1
MTFDSIHHIAVIVSDYERAKDFYVNKLGLPVLRENRRPARGDWKLDLALGEAELELFVEPHPPARVSGPEACGLRHLAFCTTISRPPWPSWPRRASCASLSAGTNTPISA